MDAWPDLISTSRTGAVEVIGEGLDYADGAEDHLLGVMQAAVDRSSGSDELARAIRDWPTKYHLSPQRANLLLPLALAPGMRVLDVGCGTGALTRHIAESGAEVIGLEGSYARAQVAAARVAGMENVRIVAGSLDDFLASPPPDVPETFDVVVACGVLEYSATQHGGAGSAPTMLAQLRSLVGDAGRLALAIENRWGLKYLLSYPEDHLGRPWVGVEGYWWDRSGTCTWSRRELGELLDHAGFSEQTWFAAYPDYKLPSALVREEMFATPEAVELVKLFVRTPITADAGEPLLVADSMSSFHSALDAGLGLELANSFLVLAGSPTASAELVTAPGIHLGGQQRAREWRHPRTVLQTPAGWVVGAEGPSEPMEHWPLRWHRREGLVSPGTNAEDLIAGVLVDEGLGSPRLEAILRRWWHESQAILHGIEKSGGQFDVLPRNFVVTSSDVWEFVDLEFEWRAPLRAEVAGLRAMLWTVAALTSRFAHIPGCPLSTTVAALAASLSHASGIDVGQCDEADLLDFESTLQAIVAGDASPAGTEAVRTRLDDMMKVPLSAFRRGLPLVRLMEEAQRLTVELERTTGESERRKEESARIASELEHATGELARLRAELEDSRALVDAMLHSRRWRLAETIRHPRSLRSAQGRSAKDRQPPAR